MTDVAPTSPVNAAASKPASEPTNGQPGSQPSQPDDVLHGPRLEQFEQEIRRLRVKGGSAEPERKLVVLGVVAVVAGFVVAAFGISMVRSAEDSLAQGDGLAQLILGVAIAVVGAVLWARYSLSRYLRYWLVRQIYEDRSATDRIVEAIERANRR